LKPAGREERLYSPLKVTDLYLQFLGTPSTTEAVGAFANRFGLLTKTLSGHEPLSVWAEALKGVWRVVETKRFLDDWDKGKLNPIAKRRKPGEELLPWEDDDSARMRRLLPGGPKRLQDMSALKSREAAVQARDLLLERLLEAANTGLREVAPSLALRPQGAGPLFAFTHQPTTLLGAIWLQVGRMLAGLGDYRECEFCGTPLGLDPANHTDRKRARRDDARFCSDNCRAKASQQRRRRELNAVSTR
jgi:hypothetical protein